MLLPVVFFVKRPQVPWSNLAAYGLLIGAGQFGLLFVAMKGHISPGLASLVVQTQVFFTIGLSIWLLRERDTAPVPEPARWPSVIAVVPARNEADVIQRSIASLLNQDYPGEFKVVLVDDQSDDGTGDLTRSHFETQDSVERGLPLAADSGGKRIVMEGRYLLRALISLMSCTGISAGLEVETLTIAQVKQALADAGLPVRLPRPHFPCEAA